MYEPITIERLDNYTEIVKELDFLLKQKSQIKSKLGLLSGVDYSKIKVTAGNGQKTSEQEHYVMALQKINKKIDEYRAWLVPEHQIIKTQIARIKKWNYRNPRHGCFTLLLMSAIRILFLVFSVIYLTALYRILGSQFNISTIEQKYNHAKTYIYLSENAFVFFYFLRDRSESVNLPTVFPATMIPPTPMNPSVPSTQSSELNSSLPSISESTPLPPVSSTLPVSNAPITTTNETYMLVLFTTEVFLCFYHL